LLIFFGALVRRDHVITGSATIFVQILPSSRIEKGGRQRTFIHQIDVVNFSLPGYLSLAGYGHGQREKLVDAARISEKKVEYLNLCTGPRVRG
jgi:hypothetical protein